MTVQDEKVMNARIAALGSKNTPMMLKALELAQAAGAMGDMEEKMENQEGAKQWYELAANMMAVARFNRDQMMAHISAAGKRVEIVPAGAIGGGVC